MQKSRSRMATPQFQEGRAYHGYLALWHLWRAIVEHGEAPAVWRLAVTRGSLLKAGVQDADLRALSKLGLAEHCHETAGNNGSNSRLRTASTRVFAETSCFIFSKDGLALARAVFPASERRWQSQCRFVEHPSATPAGIPRPVWDDDLGELSVGPLVVKRLQTAAENQRPIFQRLQRHDWHDHIANPLSENGEDVSKARMHGALVRLNGNQIIPLLRFRADGIGVGLCWMNR